MRFRDCLTMTSVAALSVGCSAGITGPSEPCPVPCQAKIDLAQSRAAQYAGALRLGYVPQVLVGPPPDPSWAGWTTHGDPDIHLACDLVVENRDDGYLSHVVAHEACHLSGIDNEGQAETCAFLLVPEWK